MAVFLLKALEGSTYVPPSCTGVFDDVACPSQFADWIEELADRQITGGCSVSPPLYCPTNPNNRGQMAVFLDENVRPGPLWTVSSRNTDPLRPEISLIGM